MIGNDADEPVPLFTPPADQPDTPVPGPLPTPPLPTTHLGTDLVISIATLTRDGRIRDKHTLTALHWHPGDHTTTHVLDNAIACTRTAQGDAIDNRGQIHIPAGPRALHGIQPGDRLLLAAVPRLALLLIHSTSVIADLLTTYYDIRDVPISGTAGSTCTEFSSPNQSNRTRRSGPSLKWRTT